MLIYVPINPTSNILNYLRYAISNASQVCMNREYVWRRSDIVCYPHQNTSYLHSNDYEFNTFHSSSFPDIYTSEKCHQNFRFATSYPVSRLLPMYNMQPYRRGINSDFLVFKIRWGNHLNVRFTNQVLKTCHSPTRFNISALFKRHLSLLLSKRSWFTVLSYFEQEIQACNLFFLFRIYWNIRTRKRDEKFCCTIWWKRWNTSNAIKTYNSAICLKMRHYEHLLFRERERKKKIVNMLEISWSYL